MDSMYLLIIQINMGLYIDTINLYRFNAKTKKKQKKIEYVELKILRKLRYFYLIEHTNLQIY